MEISYSAYVQMVDNIEGIAILLCDQNGSILKATKGINSVLGADADTYLNKTFNELFPTGINDSAAGMLQEARLKSMSRGAHWLRHNPGGLAWCKISINTLNDDDKSQAAFMIAIHPLNYVASDANLATIFEHSSEMLILSDTAGTIIACNQNARKAAIFRHREQMVPGNNVLDSIHPHRREIVENVLEQVRNGSNISYEVPITEADGKSYWFEMCFNPVLENGSVTGICLNGRDITAQKKAREITETNEKRFRALVENSADGMAILSSTGRPIYITPSVPALLGYSPEELENMNVFSITHAEDRPQLMELFNEAMANHGQPFNGPAFRIMHKDGHWRWLEGTITNYLDDPAIGGIVDNFRDVTDKINKDLALKHNKDQLQKILDNSLDIILTTDAESNITMISRSCTHLFGYTPNELIGKCAIDFIVAEEQEITRDAIRRAVGGIDIPEFSNRCCCKDGSIVSVKWSASWNEDDKTIFCIVHDATEQERIEKQLAEEQQRYAKLFDQAPSSICILRGPNLVYEMANPQYLMQTGRKDIIGKTAAEVFPELVQQGFYELLINTYKTGIPLTGNEVLIAMEINGVMKEAYMNFVYQPFKNSKGEIDGIFFFANLVSDQVMARKQIEQKEKYFRALVENAGDIILLINSEMIITYMSPALEKVTGYKLEEVHHQPLHMLIHPDFREQSSANFSQILNKDFTTQKTDSCLQHKNGSRVWVEGTITNLLADENVQGIVANLVDVTERKKTEQKLITANRLYAFISGINQAIVHASDQDTVFLEACNTATSVGNFNMAWIGLFDETKTTISLITSSGISEENKKKFKNQRFQPHGPQDHILRHQKYFVCNDLRSELNLPSWNTFIDENGLNSSMTLPIKKSGQIIGSFNLYSTIANLFDSKEIALLEEIADDISFALDVFEKERIRKQMEELLIHSELHLKQAQAIAHFGSWETDFTSGLTTWSEETCRIFGVHPSNNRFTQKARLQFVHPDDREKVSELIGTISNEKKDDTFYYRIVRADGAVRHIHSHYHFEYDGQGQPKGMFGVAHDITDTRVAIEALAQSEANLRLIIDLLPQAIFAKNTEGRYVFMNNKFASIYGATPKDMIGKSATEINFDKNEVRASLEEDQEVLRLGKAQAKKINYITDYKGVTHIYNTIKVPFTVAGKNEKAILGVAIDITEQIKAEAERTKIIADIVQRNKDLEQFSYIVSHNLRSPLANIIGISEIMKLSTTMQPDDAALLGDLLISVNRLDEVIKDLNHILQIKHSDGRDKEKVVFADLVDSIKSSIRNLIQVDDVRIIEDFSQVGAMITLKTYIYSIFFNLISNSIKYRKPDTQPVISITSSLQNGKLLITFKDNGMGIDMEKNGANIFGLYKRFHSHVDGKGVGLFMVKTQVETLGGTISLSSKVNEGTEFHLEFASY